MQLIEIVLQDVAHQAHQQVDFPLRTLPFFRAEGEQGETANTALGAGLYHRAHVASARPVAHCARQPPLTGPSSIAVHDDREMAGNPNRLVLRDAGRQLCHAQPATASAPAVGRRAASLWVVDHAPPWQRRGSARTAERRTRYGRTTTLIMGRGAIAHGTGRFAPQRPGCAP